MVRAPCCEKMGLKKGPWTREEDEILVNHVTLYGHGNWRALPKLAGLLRCGKSCRLRWTNYLRPDIKRGNFSEQEEETIINLHQALGNRWSAIAARLPGRTDNEIKNVWHTHIKKKLKKREETSCNQIISKFEREEVVTHIDQDEPKQMNSSTTTVKVQLDDEKHVDEPNSPQQISSITSSGCEDNNTSIDIENLNDFFEVDDNFWSDVFSTDENSGISSDSLGENSGATSEFHGAQSQLPFTSFCGAKFGGESDLITNEGMDFFWYNIFTKSAGELPEF